MMRLPVRIIFTLAAVIAVSLGTGTLLWAQSSSSQSSSGQTTSSQTTSNQGSINVPYTPTDPLAGVRYDNRYDLYVGAAYDHMKAGPTLLQGSNLGGLDFSGSYWLTKRWGMEGTARGYFGNSGAGPNAAFIKGPYVAQYFFDAGPEWLGPHNKHGDLIAHVLVGGVGGDFEHDLRGTPASAVAFYNNQVAFSAIMGGHFDLNRSARWVFRVTPDAMLTDYKIQYYPNYSQIDINFAISVGFEYKFKKKR